MTAQNEEEVKPAGAFCRSCGNEGPPCLCPTGLADDEGMVSVVAQCLCLKDGGDPHRMLYSGFPPEPWGDEWCRYESEARGYLRDLDRQDAAMRRRQRA